MKDTLVSGIVGDRTYMVSDDMAPPHLPVKVLSTPSMVQLIEATCLDVAQPHLDGGELTVGTHICVSHRAAVMSGDEVVVSCTLRTIDHRRLAFDVTVAGPTGEVGSGTHERAVVDASRFG